MRRRWPDVVITLAILALGAAGVWTLWGDQLRPARTPAPTVAPTGSAAPTT